MRVNALCDALALLFIFIDLTSGYSPLPPHGVFATSSTVDKRTSPDCIKHEQKFKINPFTETGFINEMLVSCPYAEKGMPPVEINITVFDYQPYTKIDIVFDEENLHADIHRQSPFEGTMYGVVQKCCLLYREEQAKKGKRDTRRVVEDDIIELPESPARVADLSI